MIDLDYLYRRILGPDGLDIPGEGENLDELIEHATAWSSRMDDLVGVLTDLQDLVERQPYLSKEEAARLREGLEAATTVLDDEASGRLVDLADDVRRYNQQLALLPREMSPCR